ncbi:hypothetical protein J2S28_004939 [Rhizobium sp. SLBN-94]|jgi:hypothetical protein|nr:hypothetical protein [Rhizobium sp. SLBN-94]
MTSADLLPTALLARKAIVYVRQSTQSQVMTNLEDQRRQYDLVDIARQRGFRDVEVIDDDLGRSASGTVARPGFDRLVALLCAGKVGAVLCFDASRLARNGRDWHHLLELCGLVEARVIDHDGVYNPCRPATFALKAGLWFRRGRLIDASPDVSSNPQILTHSATPGAEAVHRIRSHYIRKRIFSAFAGVSVLLALSFSVLSIVMP